MRGYAFLSGLRLKWVGGGVYDTAASGTAVPALPLLSATTRFCARVGLSLGFTIEVGRG